MDPVEHQQPALPALSLPPESVRDISHEADRLLFQEMLADLAWGDQYAALLAQGWGWRKAAYIAWASLPKQYRQPATMGELAPMLGLSSTRTIRQWRLQNKAIDVAVAKLSASELIDGAADAIEALKESAANPNYKHAPDRKLFFEMAGMHMPRLGLRDETPVQEESAMSEQDLKRLAGMAEDNDGDGDDAG